MHSAGDGGDLVQDRIAGQHPLFNQLLRRQPQRHPAAGDRRRARAAIGLHHVAIQHHLPLAQGLHVADGPERPPDQPLDLLGAPRLLALGRLAPAAGMGRARQHAVFGGHPALAAALQERRDRLLDAGGDQDPGMAEADQARAFRIAIDAGLEPDLAQFVVGAFGGTHGMILGKRPACAGRTRAYPKSPQGSTAVRLGT